MLARWSDVRGEAHGIGSGAAKGLWGSTQGEIEATIQNLRSSWVR